MLHELLIALSGYPGDIFRPFPLEPEVATTFAVIDFPLLHPAEKESLNRLAQLGFYFKEFNSFISACRSTRTPSHATASAQQQAAPAGLYLKAVANALERKLQEYRQVIIQTEAAILSGEDNLGAIVPLSTITARFAPFQLVFPALSNLVSEIRNASTTETPYAGGRLVDLLRDRAASGVPIQKEWMNELLQGCCAVMMRQIVSWVIYGQIQDPFGEFFVMQLQSTGEATGAGSSGGPSAGSMARSRLLKSSMDAHASPLATAFSASGLASIKWQAEYTLDESVLPAMIPATLAHAMLFIGKSIATARQAKPKPTPIPQSMTHRHLDLILPLASSTTRSLSTASNDISLEVLNMNQLTNIIYQIRRDIANHLWVVVQVGDKVVRALDSFRRYFLLYDGEFGLNLIEALEEFKRNRLSRLGQFVTANTPNVSIRDHDLGGILVKAAKGTSAQDDPALRRFELRLHKYLGGTNEKTGKEPPAQGKGGMEIGMFDDQLLGIPVRLCYTLTWPLDFFLTTEDLDHYGDVFAFLLTVRKTQVKLQQAWLDIKVMTQQMNSRKRGGSARAYTHRIKGKDGQDESSAQEVKILKHVAAMRSDMIFVVDCLWTYLQMDVIGPTYDSLLRNIITHEKEQRHGPTPSSEDSPTATSQSFDSIHSSHAEALYEIRRACLLTSEILSTSVKDILGSIETFCAVVARRSAGQDGFRSGIAAERDESMWQDWTNLSHLNQAFRSSMAKLFGDLSVVSRSGSLGDGPVLRRSVSGLSSSLLGNSAKSFDVIRQVDQLLLRLEYSKRLWFSNDPGDDGSELEGDE
ncbi:gamma-tubulin complex component protein [Gamsiella multidivaricata]|uniref:gamma-tubulin complex component protein n=1 Tax=Gamsiella multidivaricata TaxID=101098 RepID=UPI00221EAA83|nr:gamma-tubulin complex component protein [Gamsiella multidivaricata]KAI7827665.1 gamma-tubulin complex component protein [Gamsiella multidivaricata]